MTLSRLAVSAVFADPSASLALAADLATELRLPLVSDPLTANSSYLLCLTAERLELREQDSASTKRLYVDFVAGPIAHRRRFGGGRKQPLAKAIGLKGSTSPTIVDATAGLGRDAFVLACLGCRVDLVERSPIVAALLRDGLRRAAWDPEIGAMVNERLHLIVDDGRRYLQNLSESDWPDVVYLDPMYPHRRKSALVKKEMRLLRQLVGDDEDASALLLAALAAAKQRVVVKRPRLAPVLVGPTPGFQIGAPNTRFDIYPTMNRQPAG